jgi:hypothetical protein
VFVFAAIILLVGIAYSWTAQHELVHQKICEYYDGKVLSTTNNVFWGQTSCLGSQVKERAAMDSLNEIVGYNLVPVVGLLFGIFLLLLWKKE